MVVHLHASLFGTVSWQQLESLREFLRQWWRANWRLPGWMIRLLRSRPMRKPVQWQRLKQQMDQTWPVAARLHWMPLCHKGWKTTDRSDFWEPPIQHRKPGALLLKRLRNKKMHRNAETFDRFALQRQTTNTKFECYPPFRRHPENSEKKKYIYI